MEKIRGRRPARWSWRSWGVVAPLVLIALFALAGCAAGGASGGQTLSQQGNQRILSLAVDHFHPQLVYAGGDSGTIFDARPDRSVLFANKSDIPAGVNIAAILPDTQTAGVVYVGTAHGVYKTSDFGTTWQAIGTGLPTGDTIAVLAFGASPTTLLAGTVQHGVYASADGGATWAARNNGLPGGAVNVNALLSDSTTGATYLAVDQAGLFVSTDDGQQWRRSGQGLPTGADPLALAELPQKGLNPNGPTLYAGTSQGLFASKDGGASWGVNSGQGVSGSVVALATDPGQPGALYAADGDAVLRSMDGGATWTSLISGFSKPVLAIVVVDGGAQPTIFATNDQVYRYPTLSAPGGSPAGGILFLVVLVLVLATGFWAFRRVRRQMRETMAHYQEATAESSEDAGSGETENKPAEDDSPSPASRNGHKPR